MLVEEVQHPLHRFLARFRVHAGRLEILARAPEAHLLRDDAPGDGGLDARARHHDPGAGDGVAVAPSHRVRPCEELVPVLGRARGVEPGLDDVVDVDLRLKAHQVHRDHVELVAGLRVAGRLEREIGEVGEIEPRPRDDLVERGGDPVLGELRVLTGDAPAEVGGPAGRDGGEDLRLVLVVGDVLHLDLDALVLVGVVEGVDHLGPDLLVGGAEPVPVKDLVVAARVRPLARHEGCAAGGERGRRARRLDEAPARDGAGFGLGLSRLTFHDVFSFSADFRRGGTEDQRDVFEATRLLAHPWSI